MATNAERASAFEAAIAYVDRMLARPARTADEGARQKLAHLRASLVAERIASAERGAVDADWLRATIKAADVWVADDDLPLIAALGRIARAQ
jgi:hypothetical protein